MEQVQNGLDISSLFFNKKAFKYLSKWILIINNSWKLNIKSVLLESNKIHPQFNSFIKDEGINKVWDKLQNNSKSKKQFINQFHCWFDGLKTIKFLKYFSK